MKKSKLLMIALPVTILLFCYAAYEYGYLAIQLEKIEMGEKRSQKERMLLRYLATISQRQHIQSALVFLRPLKKVNDEGIIKAQEPAKAADALNSILKEVFSQKGGVISREKPQEPQKTGALTVMVMEIDAVLPDAGALHEIVYAIETHPFLMVIKRMDVKISDKNNPRELSAKFEIAALYGGL